jgi:beta-xylosidase
MAYKKLLVDNTTCSRRFHITFDDEGTPLDHVELRCQHCNEVIFSEDNHPRAKLARDENLIKKTSLSDHLVTNCAFEDRMPKG